MLNSKLKRTTLALVLAVVLMLSLFPVAAYALEDAGSAAEGEDGIVLDAGLAGTADTDADKADDEPSETGADTTATTGTDEDHDHDHDHDHEDEETEKEEEKKGFGLGDIISLSILGVVIILVVIYCLTHKEKVGKLLRGLKSEMGKIVWTPWNQVRKNTIVVLVVVIATIIVLYVLDLLFSKGIFALSKIF